MDIDEIKAQLIAAGWGPLRDRPCGLAEMTAICTATVQMREIAVGPLLERSRIIDEAMEWAQEIDAKVRARLAEQHVDEPEPSGRAKLGPRKLKRRK